MNLITYAKSSINILLLSRRKLLMIIMFSVVSVHSSICFAADAHNKAQTDNSRMAVYDVTFNFDPAFRDGPGISWKWLNLPSPPRKEQPFESKTIKLYVPKSIKNGDVIRGIMSARYYKGFEDFSERNNIVFYDYDGSMPYAGPHKTFLKEAAKVCGHPELEHAGAIVLGLSNLGRQVAHFAHFWPERTIAVLLDHSAAPSSPTQNPKIYEYDQLPAALGVPYFFNSEQKDMHQGINRRIAHYNWCTAAFNDSRASQPCTSVISFEDVGHTNPGTREFEITWLEEVMKLRVPEKISPDGKPYQLIPVNPRSVGGHVYAKAVTHDGRTIHTSVDVGPIGFKNREISWWIPGPKSAAMYVKWVKKNDGEVRTDLSAKIK
jgi:hypothetical protein